MKIFRNKKAQATLEYIVLITFILATILVFQKYIARAFSGRWKIVGDSLGEGRIFDPVLTEECAADTRHPDVWYDVKCFEANCEGPCNRVGAALASCQACIDTCAAVNPRCQ